MYQPYFTTISVKGIVFETKKVWLRRNERDEWEIPGGKLERGEQPEVTVVRELREELGLDVTVLDIIQAHMYTLGTSFDEENGVAVITYLCKLKERIGSFEHEGEAGHAEFRAFLIEEIADLNMPQFYKDAVIKACFNQGAATGAVLPST